MHKVLGWIAISLLIIGTAVGAWLAGGALSARTNWMAKIEAKQKQVTTAENDLRVAKLEFETARNDLHNERDLWGRHWEASNSSPSPARDGTVELGVGTNAGLDPAKVKVVYAFGKNPDGTVEYVGDLNLLDVRGDSAGGQLTRVPYPNEVEGWPSGEYRVREDIPASYRSTIDELRARTYIAMQALSHEEENVKRQTENLANSQNALAIRLGELNGNPQAPAEAGPDIVDGLVQRLRIEEAERNTVSKVVDALRRELSDQHLTLTKMLAANQERLTAAGAEAAAQKTVAPRVAAQK